MSALPDDIQAHLDSVQPAKRRRDAVTMIELMRRVTGLEPVLNGTMIGFGSYHYRYDSGHSGVAAAASFAPRKTATVIYLPDGIGSHATELAALGPHTTGVGCLYLKDLEDNDLDVLESIVATSYGSVVDGTYTKRAREGGAGSR